MKAIKYLLITLLFVISTIANAQKGKINEYGFFTFNKYKHMLQYLDFCRKNEINGIMYVYFEVKNKQNASSEYVVIPIETSRDELLTTLKLNKYVCLKKGISNSRVPHSLQSYFVNKDVLGGINKMSQTELFNRFVGNNGELIYIDDSEQRKAVILNLLKDNYVVFEHGVSGSASLSTTLIKW